MTTSPSSSSSTQTSCQKSQLAQTLERLILPLLFSGGEREYYTVTLLGVKQKADTQKQLAFLTKQETFSQSQLVRGYLSFRDWLTSLRTTSSRSLHATARVTFYSTASVDHTSCIRSPARALGPRPPPGLAAVHSAVTKRGCAGICPRLHLQLFRVCAQKRHRWATRQCCFQSSEEPPIEFSFHGNSLFSSPSKRAQGPGPPHSPNTGLSGFLRQPLGGRDQKSVISSNFICLYYVGHKSRKNRVISPVCPGRGRYSCAHRADLV